MSRRALGPPRSLPTEDPIETVASSRVGVSGAARRARARHEVDHRLALTCAAVAVAWAALLVTISTQPVFLTTDMVSNHVHVWFIADAAVALGHGIPLHMPVLASGDAYARSPTPSCRGWSARCSGRSVVTEWSRSC